MSNSRRFRAELGRLFIQHKADLALNNWTDAEIVANVNTITGTPLSPPAASPCSATNRPWLSKHRWFSAWIEVLLNDQVAVPLDGCCEL